MGGRYGGSRTADYCLIIQRTSAIATALDGYSVAKKGLAWGKHWVIYSMSVLVRWFCRYIVLAIAAGRQ